MVGIEIVWQGHTTTIRLGGALGFHQHPTSSSFGFGIGCKSIIPLKNKDGIGLGIMSRFVSEHVGIALKITYELSNRRIK